MGLPLEALWLFSDEFNSVSAWERFISAHTSQRIGKPLHKHEGYLFISEEYMRFYNSEMELLCEVKRDAITDIIVGYNGFFRRLRDSRGFIPPIKVILKDKTIYMSTKPIGRKGIIGSRVFKGKDEAILTWFKNPIKNSLLSSSYTIRKCRSQ